MCILLYMYIVHFSYLTAWKNFTISKFVYMMCDNKEIWFDLASITTNKCILNGSRLVQHCKRLERFTKTSCKSQVFTQKNPWKHFPRFNHKPFLMQKTQKTHFHIFKPLYEACLTEWRFRAAIISATSQRHVCQEVIKRLWLVAEEVYNLNMTMYHKSSHKLQGYIWSNSKK